jgi:oligopeptide/dipeptide ABC transporter ATP-binding protein
MTEPLLSMEDLQVEISVRRQLGRVLWGVSLHIDPGEAVGLVGESGSGKSMTAKAAVRALPATARVTSGEVRFRGVDVNSMDSRDLREMRTKSVSVIGQNPRATMNPLRRVGDLVTEALRTNLGVGANEARAEAIRLLEQVSIESPERVLDQYPHQLSGGMLQRCVIAAALATNPQLVIADEPTSSLDVTTQAEVMAIINDLRTSRGDAMLFISHDLDLTAAICDRTYVVYAGRIVEEQPSASLHTDPKHPYSWALAEARPRVDRDLPRLVTIPGHPASAFDRGRGCAFAPRCQFSTDQCVREQPPMTDTGRGHVACWHWEEISLTHDHGQVTEGGS